MAINRFDRTIISKVENKQYAVPEELRQALHNSTTTQVLMIEDNTEFATIVGHLLGADLGEAEVGFRIDQPGIDRHAADIYDLRAARDFDFAGFADGGDFSARHHQHAIVNHAMGDGQQLAAS